MTCPEGDPARSALRLGPASSVLVLCTEGATDPVAWQQIVGSTDSAGTGNQMEAP
jgi:diaminopropionate ammonia-lyase